MVASISLKFLLYYFCIIHSTAVEPLSTTVYLTQSDKGKGRRGIQPFYGLSGGMRQLYM